MISRAIAACRATGKYVGICGQGPSDHPDFADWLAAEGIVSISLNPDTRGRHLAAAGDREIGARPHRQPVRLGRAMRLLAIIRSFPLPHPTR